MDRELARALALFDREVGPLMPAPRRVASNIAPARRGANDRAHHARSAAPANARSAVPANAPRPVPANTLGRLAQEGILPSNGQRRGGGARRRPEAEEKAPPRSPAGSGADGERERGQRSSALVERNHAADARRGTAERPARREPGAKPGRCGAPAAPEGVDPSFAALVEAEMLLALTLSPVPDPNRSPSSTLIVALALTLTPTLGGDAPGAARRGQRRRLRASRALGGRGRSRGDQAAAHRGGGEM